MTATGTIKFDGLAVVTIEANMLEKTLSARAAFINTKTGDSHGFTDGAGHVWSTETKKALHALAALIEQDMGKMHFTSISATTPTETATSVGGLGEHVGSDTTPSA